MLSNLPLTKLLSFGSLCGLLSPSFWFGAEFDWRLGGLATEIETPGNNNHSHRMLLRIICKNKLNDNQMLCLIRDNLFKYIIDLSGLMMKKSPSSTGHLAYIR